METIQGVAIQTVSSPVKEKTVCLSLNLGKPGNSKALRKSQYQVDADPGWTAASKKLLDSQPYADITKFFNQIRARVRQYGFDSLLKSGIYRIPYSLVEKLQAEMEAYRDQFEVLRRAAAADYENAIWDAQRKLNGTFNPGDYLSLEAYLSKFYITWQWFEYGTAENMKRISPEIARAEANREREEIRAVFEDAKSVLRLQFQKLVDHMVDILTGKGSNGKPKRIFGTLTGNMNQFLELFDDRNIADDDELQNLVDRMKKLLAGVRPEDIRDIPETRERLATAVAAVQDQLSALAIDADREIEF